MKWKINKKGFIEDENGTMVCAFLDEVDEFSVRLIKNAPDMFLAILDYKETIEKGKNPSKKIYDEFKKILDNIGDY